MLHEVIKNLASSKNAQNIFLLHSTRSHSEAFAIAGD